jgi:hypothetical protein
MTTLVIGKHQSPSTKLLSEDPVLFAQILDGALLLLVHTSGDGNHYEPKWI